MLVNKDDYTVHEEDDWIARHCAIHKDFDGDENREFPHIIFADSIAELDSIFELCGQGRVDLYKREQDLRLESWRKSLVR